MTYNVFDLCEDKGDYFEVDPAVMFPATLARIKECLVSEPPIEIMTPGWTGRPDREPVADKFVRQAEGFPGGAWELALKPFADFPVPDPDPDKDKELKAMLALRAATLAFVESWFKRALALVVGHGVRIHISKNLDYRR